MSKLSAKGQLLRFEKGTRYYTLILNKDLLSDWIVAKVNGRINSRLGQINDEACSSYQEALARFKELIWYRQFKRYYTLV